MVRLGGRRKKGFLGSTTERMLLPTAGIADAKHAGRARNVLQLQLQFKPDETLAPLVCGQIILLTLDAMEDVSELLDFLDMA